MLFKLCQRVLHKYVFSDQSYLCQLYINGSKSVSQLLFLDTKLIVWIECCFRASLFVVLLLIFFESPSVFGVDCIFLCFVCERICTL
jgi:hypothetical protein